MNTCTCGSVRHWSCNAGCRASYDMRSVVGQQIVSAKDEIMGTATYQFFEDGRWWAIIDEAYEADLTGCSEVLDLMGTMRASNPALSASFIRLKD